MNPTRQPVNFRLPTDVVKAARARARKDKMSVTTVVEAALRVYLDVYPSWVPKQKGRVRP